VTAAVSAHLLDQAQRRADEARERGAEVARLSALGAEALNAPRADLAVTGVANVIRETLPVERCAVHTRHNDRSDDLVAAVLQRGVAFSELPDGTTRAMRSDTGQTGEWWIGAPTRRSPPASLRCSRNDGRRAELAQAGGFEFSPAQQRMLTQ
jgi:hypothetical protein